MVFPHFRNAVHVVKVWPVEKTMAAMTSGLIERTLAEPRTPNELPSRADVGWRRPAPVALDRQFPRAHVSLGGPLRTFTDSSVQAAAGGAATL